jgi:prepilin-type N-terminal cleavage/methylation domain-containing protein
MKKNIEKAGFTLFELLIVISIIGLLIAAASVAYSGVQQRGRDARRKEDIQAVQKALEMYYAKNVGYPDNCTPGDEFLPGGLPADPKSDTYNYSYDCDAATDTYCICAELEQDGIGNSSDSSCTWGAGNYYCVANQQ